MNRDKFEKMEARYQELEAQLGEAALMEDQARYQKIAKEYSDLGEAVGVFRRFKGNEKQIADLEHLLKDEHDQEFEQMAKEELQTLQEAQARLEKELEDLGRPKSGEKDRDLIIEIRAGTGGQEASLFAADLNRMYSKYAEKKNWKVEAISHHESETGGFKEVIFSISGKGASRLLKWESGVHRVQRVPVTEASGRIHTSAATVAVLYEPEEIEINIEPKDLKIDVFRSSGPGGQSVNTTDSAVRITHLPTGIVVVCQDERSQMKNKLKAMRVLRARLLDKIKQENFAKTTQDRKAKIGTGDRSEKIRTYNFPEHRVTDHRIGLTIHRLPTVMDGDIDEITGALVKAEQDAEAQD